MTPHDIPGSAEGLKPPQEWQLWPPRRCDRQTAFRRNGVQNCLRSNEIVIYIVKPRSKRPRASRGKSTTTRYHLEMASLVPTALPHDGGLSSLHSRVAGLEATFEERAADIDRVKSELAAFAQKYKEHVGELHEQLEELELAIAEAELGEIAKRLANEAADGSPPSNPGFDSLEPNGTSSA